jgi:hypothetical protein
MKSRVFRSKVIPVLACHESKKAKDKLQAAYSRKSSPTCKDSWGLARPRAHAARKMDIDGFSMHSTSLMTMGERYSDTPRSWRTSAAQTLSTQSFYGAQQRTYSCIRVSDKTSPHAHLTQCMDYKVLYHQLFRRHGKAAQREDARVTRVSSKSLYPSRELNRFRRLGTMVLRCLSTACGSAPAPTAVREITSDHHFSTPARYDGLSACSCRSATVKTYRVS